MVFPIRNPPFEIRNASFASGGVLDADLRSATTDRGPQAAFGRDDGPSSVDYGLSSEHRLPSIVYGLITGRSLGSRSRDGNFPEAFQKKK